MTGTSQRPDPADAPVRGSRAVTHDAMAPAPPPCALAPGGRGRTASVTMREAAATAARRQAQLLEDIRNAPPGEFGTERRYYWSGAARRWKILKLPPAEDKKPAEPSTSQRHET